MGLLIVDNDSPNTIQGKNSKVNTKLRKPFFVKQLEKNQNSEGK